MLFRRNMDAERMLRQKTGTCDMHVFTCRTGRGWGYTIVCDVRTGMWSGTACRTDLKRSANGDKVRMGGENAHFKTQVEVQRLCEEHYKRERRR